MTKDDETFIRDPKTGAMVSVYGNDQGPAAPRRKFCRGLDSKGRPVYEAARETHVTEVFEPDTARRRTVRKVKAPIDRLLAAGDITKSQFDAGIVFKDKYDLAGFDRISAVDWTRAGDTGGKRDFENARVVDARAWMFRIREVLVGPDSEWWSIMVQVIGLENSLNEYANGSRYDRKCCKGFLVSALMLVDRDLRGK